MKKIITAIGNPNLNNKLREINRCEILSKDIQYKEGIIEILEKNNDVDILILNNSIPGESEIKEFINKLLQLKNNLEIIIFLENEDNEITNFLNSKGIFKIYTNLEINLEEFIKNLKDIEINTTEEITQEINKLKKLILNETNTDNFNNNEKIINSKNIKIKKDKEIIVISGTFGVRKKYIFHNISTICGKTKCKNTIN